MGTSMGSNWNNVELIPIKASGLTVQKPLDLTKKRQPSAHPWVELGELETPNNWSETKYNYNESEQL